MSCLAGLALDDYTPNMADVPTHSVPAMAAQHRRLWLLATLVFVLLRAVPNVTYPIGRDQATFLVIGEGLLRGEHLYLDLWDNKPPGVFYLFAAITKIFGPVMWGVGVVDILWLLVVSYWVFRFAERYLGTAAAAVTVVVNATWHVQAGYWQAAQTETFLILTVFAAFFLAAGEGRRTKLRHFFAGVLCGAAFWLKYNAVALFPVVILLPYLDARGLDGKDQRIGLSIPWRDWITRVSAFGSGFTVTVVAVLMGFRFSGSWEALKEVQFEVLPRYSAMALERTPQYFLWGLYQTEMVLGIWTEIAFVLALAVAWKKRQLARLAPVMLSAGLGYACVVLQVRFHAYAFETAFPFFAMVWGYLAVTAFQEFRRIAERCAARGWKVARVLVWVLFANLAAWPLPAQVASIMGQYRGLAGWMQNREVFYSSYPWANPVSHLADQMQVIGYLRRKLAAGDDVYVWGSEPLIYFLTRRACPSRFITNLALLSPWSPPAWRDELVGELTKAPPRFLVVARNDAVSNITYSQWDSEEYLQAYPELAIFISDHYAPDKNLRNFAIYQRRESPQLGRKASAAPSQGRRPGGDAKWDRLIAGATADCTEQESTTKPRK